MSLREDREVKDVIEIMRQLVLKFKDGHISEKPTADEEISVGYMYPRAEVIQIKEYGKVISDTKIGDRLYSIDEMELLTKAFNSIFENIKNMGKVLFGDLNESPRGS